MQNDINLHCCCFTGHRPEKLKYSEEEIKPLLADVIDRAIADGYTTFITGIAPGTDILAAELVLEKKNKTTSFASYAPCPTPASCGANPRARRNATAALSGMPTVFPPFAADTQAPVTGGATNSWWICPAL